MPEAFNEAKLSFDAPLDRLEAEVCNALRASRPKEFEATADTSRGPQTVRSLILDIVGRQVANNSAQIREVICTKLKYCEFVDSDRFKIAIDVANNIAAGVIALHIILPIPTIKIAVYLLRVGFFDDFCNCTGKRKW